MLSPSYVCDGYECVASVVLPASFDKARVSEVHGGDSRMAHSRAYSIGVPVQTCVCCGALAERQIHEIELARSQPLTKQNLRGGAK